MMWVPLPIKHDGDGYTELLDHKDGAAHFAAWVTITQVAARCQPRGTLLRDTRQPHDSRSLARMTRIPKEIYDKALPRLVQIGWLSSEPFTEHNFAGGCQEGDSLLTVSAHPTDEEGKGREWNGMEEKTISSESEDGSELLTDWAFPVVGANSKDWIMPTYLYDELAAAYPDLNQEQMFREARAWLIANTPKRKTARGMPRFLNSWFERNQNSSKTTQASATNDPRGNIATAQRWLQSRGNQDGD